MNSSQPHTTKCEKSEFSHQAELHEPGIVQEFWDFLCFNKKWWLTPIIIVLLLISVLIFLSGTPMAPFLYQFF